jgi:transcriptional regulator with XRE-family HTH domain
VNRIDRSSDFPRIVLKAALEAGVFTCQEEAASVLGCDRSTVSRRAHGGLPVTYDDFARMLDYLGTEGLLRALAHLHRVDLATPRAVPAADVVDLAVRTNSETAEALAATVRFAAERSPAARRKAIREHREAVEAHLATLDRLVEDDLDDEPTTHGIRLAGRAGGK